MTKVIIIKFLDHEYDYHSNDEHATPLIVGHAIGQLRRPISFNDDEEEIMSISFPIRDDSEFEMFKRHFRHISKHIKMEVEEQDFVHDVDVDVPDCSS